MTTYKVDEKFNEKNEEFKSRDDYAFDQEMLARAFAEAKEIYKERGFQTRMGYGKAPAITTVDMARAWMEDGHAFTCDKSEEVCANARKVLDAGRKSGVPIFHTTTGFDPEAGLDCGRWDEKIPLHTLVKGSYWMEIDPRLDPQPTEPVIYKPYASNFFGTRLAQLLTYLGVDTLIVMGATACACVRHTVMDSTGYGFKTIVPEGTIGDRVPGVVEWNLFDMDAKFADVEPVDAVVKYLEGIDNSVYTRNPNFPNRFK